MDLLETNRWVIEQFRAGGAIDGMTRDRLLLLTTTGRRSGVRRTSPMMFHRTDDELYVIASAAGALHHPAWYLNLVEEPHVHVEVGDQSYDALARPLPPAERDPIWAQLKEAYPFFADHEAQTDRTIPVVSLRAG